MAPQEKTITDIRHSLTERGEVPEALPNPSAQSLGFPGWHRSGRVRLPPAFQNEPNLQWEASHRASSKLDASGRLWLQIPGLLCIELFQRTLLQLGELTEVKLGDKEPIRFRFLGVRYAEDDRGVVELDFTAG